MLPLAFGEKLRIVLNLSFKFEVGRGLSRSHILHPFLLALYINLATDVAKLGVSRTHLGGDTGGQYPVKQEPEPIPSCGKTDFSY